MRSLIVLILLFACFVSVSSQQQSSQTRAVEIAASFNKHKSAVKEKNGVRIEKYKDVRSEAVVKPNISEYSGVYEVSDLGFAISIQVGSDGRIVANGHDAQSRSFRLGHASIESGLLTGTKVYSDGAAEKFEGVFMTRTERSSPTAAGVTTFGLGVILSTPFEQSGNTYERLFYQFKR
jgi:hypothetical protein